MTLSRCNRNYHRMKILDRGVFASGVLEAYYKNNPPFTALVMPETDFKNCLKITTAHIPIMLTEES